MSRYAPFEGSTEIQLLDTQEMFEQLIGRSSDMPHISGSTVIYFTASWCSACRRIKLDEVVNACKHIRLLKCDVDLNNYTAGFCNIKSIPTFLAIKDLKIIGQLGSSDTTKIVDWVTQLFPEKK